MRDTGPRDAHHVARPFGPDAIVCFGEETDGSDRRTKLIPPEAFFAAGAHYDLALTSTLCRKSVARQRRYLTEIASHARLILSINHKAGDFTVRELIDHAGLTERTRRFPSWIRPGYATTS